MSRRGVTLAGTLWMLAVLGVLMSATLSGIGMIRARLLRHKELEQAAAMAVSGQDYAAALQRQHKSIVRYRSPEFPGGGHFELEPGGAGVVSTGVCGPSRYRLDKRP